MLKKHLILPILLLGILPLSKHVQGQDIQSGLTAEQRESQIQKALQFRKEGNVYQAIEQVDMILNSGPDDEDALMLKGDLLAQSQQYDVASTIYQQLLDLDDQKIQAQINLSYALFMDNKPAQALKQARSAWEKEVTNKNAVVNYFNALLWNVKTNDAVEFFDRHQSLLDRDQILVMSARLYTSQGHYKRGLRYYDTLVAAYSNKHYVREYAEVLISKKEQGRAEKLLESVQSLFTRDEFQHLLDAIESSRKDLVGSSVSLYKDIARNIGISNEFWWQHHRCAQVKLKMRAGWSDLRSIEKDRTTTKHLGFRLNKKFDISLRSQTEMQVQQISFNHDRQYLVLTGQQSLTYQPHDRLNLGLFFKSEILNYTASLLSQNIRINALGYRMHLMINGKNGFYSQGDLGSLSDGNRRTQFFGSIYNIFNRTPLIKAGVNVSALSYHNNQVSEYFAASRFRSTELFVEYQSSRLGIPGLSLSAQAAMGAQQIEYSNWDPTFRIQAKLSYQHNGIEASLQYQTSNVASTNGVGYQFDRLGFSFSCRL